MLRPVPNTRRPFRGLSVPERPIVHSLRSPCAVMVIVLGHREGTADVHALAEAVRSSDVAIHLYGKRQVRPKRKMGHVTCLGNDLKSVRRIAEDTAEKLKL